MPSYNKVILMGNLTRDPELRSMPSGNSICKIGIAVSRKFQGQNGMQEETTFVDIDAFGRSAENIAKYFSKGKPILVEGRLKLDQWEDKQSGQKRSKMGVVLERFEFVGGRQDSEGGGNYGGGQQGGYEQSSPPPRQQSGGGNYNQDIDEDVPF